MSSMQGKESLPESGNLTLGAVAEQHDLRLVSGAADMPIHGVCPLDAGQPGQLAYAAGHEQSRALAGTTAGAVIVPEPLVQQCPVATLVATHPQLAFARIAALFEYQPRDPVGIHATAVVHADARLGHAVSVGANAVIGAGCEIGAGTSIGANAVLGDNVRIGDHGRIGANATIHYNVRIGARVRVGSAAVIGGRGFGLVHTGSGWEEIPQLGTVIMGDDVEVGASTTVDRGALADTVIGDHVRIDNQIQIGHNCHIGARTVIAGAAGIAGSVTIGNDCLVGGGVGIGDHVTIVDNVVITAASQVPSDITEAGVWSSTFRVMPAGQWRRLLARFRRLGQMDRRLRQLEKTT